MTVVNGDGDSAAFGNGVPNRMVLPSEETLVKSRSNVLPALIEIAMVRTELQTVW